MLERCELTCENRETVEPAYAFDGPDGELFVADRAHLDDDGGGFAVKPVHEEVTDIACHGMNENAEQDAHNNEKNIETIHATPPFS